MTNLGRDIPPNRLDATGTYWRRWGRDYGWPEIFGVVVVEFWEPLPCK